MNKKTLFYTGLLATSMYMAYITSFVLRMGYEVYILVFLLFLILGKFKSAKLFINDWAIYIGLFAIYEVCRSFADDYSLTRQFTLNAVYNIENLLGILWIYPYLQSVYFSLPQIKELIIFNVYSIFFYYSIFFSFIFWIIDRKLFFRYALGFLLLCYVGTFFFFLMPVSPPWMYNSIEFPITRVLSDLYTEWDITKGVNLVTYLVNGNEVAAFPSFHAGWVAYTSFFIIFAFPNKKWLFPLMILPVLVSISVVVSGEHFITDVIAGFVLAYVVAFFATKNKLRIINILNGDNS